VTTLAVVGGGSWGTALAAHVARSGRPVRLWVRRADLARALVERRENADHLPGIVLPEGIAATTDLAAAVTGAGTVIVVVPSEFSRGTLRRLRPLLDRGAVVVSAAKGLEIETMRRITEVAEEEAPGHAIAALSGPSFALEVARGQPTAVVVASADVEVAEAVQRMLSTRTFRVYASADVVGVELGGALKNVIAIASGIVSGLGHGHNTVAALVTRGLAEITRLAVARGARPETLAGLAGLGDLVLTCTGSLSRNRRVGEGLGAGRGLETALAAAGGVAEGVRTTLAACALAERAGVEMPIARQMRAVLYDGKPPGEAVDELMLRSLKRE
jgi:glycerol-3-phosphate dehydrogenase (NAD(P)+)